MHEQRGAGTARPIPWAGARAASLGLAAALTAAPAQGQAQGVEKLERRLEALETEQAREIEALNRQVEALTAALEATGDQGAAPQAPNLFNPAISVMGTFLGRVDDMRAFEEDDPSAERIDDRMTLREAEIDLRAPISPWVEGVLIVELEAEEGGHEAGVEEGYVTLGRLPLMETTPGGLRLKAGLFAANFGRLNRVHQHDLPQPTLPRSLARFMGSDGYIETGVSGQFFLPTASDRLSLEGTLEVLNGGGLPPESTGSTSDAAILGQLRTFAELGDASTFDLGTSAWSDGSERSLYGIDATYQWLPPSQGTWQSFILGSELFLGDFDQVGLDEDPRGGYVYAQYQFDTWTYFGARYDRSQELDDASIETDSYTVYVTRYAAEFLRFRVAYERAESDLALIDGRDTVLLEINFVYGVHPIDPYWVHR